MSMYIERKQDLSIIYFLKDLFADTEYVTVLDAFPMGELTIPCISVETDTIDTAEYQLGDFDRLEFRVWFIDVFAKNKSQRDEMGYKIVNELKSGIAVYNYDEGFPPDFNPTKVGKLIPDIIKLKNIRVLPEFVEKLYYRCTITFTATYEQIT